MGQVVDGVVMVGGVVALAGMGSGAFWAFRLFRQGGGLIFAFLGAGLAGMSAGLLVALGAIALGY
jgi:hypothetical protein